MKNKTKKIIEALEAKYSELKQDKDIFLEGLLYSKSLNYWDYIQTDSLLNLQIQRTNFPDEMVFLLYHQVNELIFKMILWELKQVAELNKLCVDFFTEKLMRISRYFDILTSSFEIMKDGMDINQYNKFRLSLSPGSGFQSAQYRKIEFASTELINLIDLRYRNTINRETPFENAFEHLYWQAAGKNYKTSEKTIMIKNFEKKYKQDFIYFMKTYNTRNLWTRYKELSEKNKKDHRLIKAMRHYDYTVNISWVMGHYNTAKHYILSSSSNNKATGGSEWQKYMHPKYQKRIFFPDLWSADEIDNWGNEV
jgi:tryptophan 2,3-dioxygenase